MVNWKHPMFQEGLGRLIKRDYDQLVIMGNEAKKLSLNWMIRLEISGWKRETINDAKKYAEIHGKFYSWGHHSKLWGASSKDINKLNRMSAWKKSFWSSE